MAWWAPSCAGVAGRARGTALPGPPTSAARPYAGDHAGALPAGACGKTSFGLPPRRRRTLRRGRDATDGARRRPDHPRKDSGRWTRTRTSTGSMPPSGRRSSPRRCAPTPGSRSRRSSTSCASGWPTGAAAAARQVARGRGPRGLRRADLRREQRGDGRLGHRHPVAATRDRARAGGGLRRAAPGGAAWHRPPRAARSATTRTDRRRHPLIRRQEGPAMPTAPLPDEVEAMLARPNHAVIASSRPDGQPVSVATWYLYEEGRILVNMDEGRRRLAYLREDPRVSLTAMDPDDWYTHVSVQGRIVPSRTTPSCATSTGSRVTTPAATTPTRPRPGQRVDRDRHLARLGRPAAGLRPAARRSRAPALAVATRRAAGRRRVRESGHRPPSSREEPAGCARHPASCTWTSTRSSPRWSSATSPRCAGARSSSGASAAAASSPRRRTRRAPSARARRWPPRRHAAAAPPAPRSCPPASAAYRGSSPAGHVPAGGRVAPRGAGLDRRGVRRPGRRRRPRPHRRGR